MTTPTLTRQGVRDLNGLPATSRGRRFAIPKQCDHRGLKECCPGCGHWKCPKCDLYWDVGAER